MNKRPTKAVGDLEQSRYETELAQWRQTKLERQRKLFKDLARDGARRRSRQAGGCPRRRDFITGQKLPANDIDDFDENHVDRFELDSHVDSTSLVDPLRLFLITCLIHDYGADRSIRLTAEIDKEYWKVLRELAQVNGLADSVDYTSRILLTRLIYNPAAVLGIHWDYVLHMLTTWPFWPGWNALNGGTLNMEPMDTDCLAYKIVMDKEVIIPTLFAEPLPAALDPRLEQYLLDDLFRLRKEIF